MQTDHYYVYYMKDGSWVYERTCSTKYAADIRLHELLKFYVKVVWYKNYILKGAFY